MSHTLTVPSSEAVAKTSPFPREKEALVICSQGGDGGGEALAICSQGGVRAGDYSFLSCRTVVVCRCTTRHPFRDGPGGGGAREFLVFTVPKALPMYHAPLSRRAITVSTRHVCFAVGALAFLPDAQLQNSAPKSCPILLLGVLWSAHLSYYMRSIVFSPLADEQHSTKHTLHIHFFFFPHVSIRAAGGRYKLLNNHYLCM